jgi:flagellar motor switch protein FliN/FliY
MTSRRVAARAPPVTPAKNRRQAGATMNDVDIDEIKSYDVDSSRGANVEEAFSKPSSARDGGPRINSIMRIPVMLQVIVGSTTLPVADLLKLGRGAVIPLNSRVGDPVEVTINGRTIARGEVVVIEDDNTRFGVSLTEILEPHLGDRHE